MELEAFRAHGIRCLADVDWVPVARPTILTGANDGGKTSLLLGLSFLLTGKALPKEDFTSAVDGEELKLPVVEGRYAECWIESQFRLNEEEQELTGLGEKVHIRRRQEISGQVSLEFLTSAPSDERLRGLDALKLDELKDIAAKCDVEIDGPKNQRASYIEPLAQFAASQPHEQVWVPLGHGLNDRLPRLISFASTTEPDPEADIRQALQEAYARTLEDGQIVGPVRKAEKQVRAKLESEAEELRRHIIE